MEKKTQPEVIDDGHLKAKIWRNESENGPFFRTTFSRTYKDDNGEYQDTQSFTSYDLLRISELARLAYNRTKELRREHAQRQEPRLVGKEQRRGAFKEQRGSGSDERPPRRRVRRD